ncbi:MAG: F0F1 ATP synthase subunit epsilon [Gemmatimonadota bacterium]|nr:F0F1 ATP synthase subunit epsilon [Gemmatimonadota bacterium]
MADQPTPIDRDGPWDDMPSAGDLSIARQMRVKVISPSSAAFDGPAASVVAPAHDGEVGILYGHAPMVVLLGTGELRIHTIDGDTRFRVSRGFMQVVDNEISVLAEEVEPIEG